jgi:hypothetical protein
MIRPEIIYSPGAGSGSSFKMMKPIRASSASQAKVYQRRGAACISVCRAGRSAGRRSEEFEAPWLIMRNDLPNNVSRECYVVESME